MSKKRIFDTRFWSDTWVVDKLNPLDRYLFMYLIENDKTNIAGIYELSLRTASNETGIEQAELRRMIDKLAPKVYYREGWVVMVNSIKHQNYHSPKIAKGIMDELRQVPRELLGLIAVPHDFKAPTGVDDHGEIRYAYGMDTVSHLIKLNSIKLNSINPPNPHADADPAIQEKLSPAVRVAPTPSKDIDRTFEMWAEIVGYEIASGRERNRKAASNLLKKYGWDDLEKLIRGVAQAATDKYAPRISDFAQLQSKQNDLMLWGRKRGHSNAINKF